jgi:dCMP deaminase
MAREVASYSKDPSTQTGAVFVSPDKKDVIVGYNGFASRMNDDPALYADRAEKYERIIHCEMNALINAKRPLDGYTLYTWPFISCHRCAVHMVQAGIARNIAPKPDATKETRWGDQFARSRRYFAEGGVEVVEFDLVLYPIDDVEAPSHADKAA